MSAPEIAITFITAMNILIAILARNTYALLGWAAAVGWFMAYVQC